MNCQDSEQNIQAFIDDRLWGDALESFLWHITTCKACFDETETGFLLKEALVRLEDGDSFDLHSELKEKIATMQICVRVQNRMAIIRRILLTVAGLMLSVEMLYLYLTYL